MNEAVTFFASPERSSPEEIRCAKNLVESQQLLKRALDSLPDVILILDGNRQIVYLNDAILSLLGQLKISDAFGMRPGELFNCERAAHAPSGCGTSKFCAACGLVNAALDAMKTGKRSQRECRIVIEGTCEALELKVVANPLKLDGKNFVITAISDISAEKRKQSLERIFFHDALNLAGGIQSMSAMIKASVPRELEDLAATLSLASDELVEELSSQRLLNKAERGELLVNAEPQNSQELIHAAAEIYRRHEVSAGKTIYEEPSPETRFVTDRSLLLRALCNLLKNALEALPQGGVARIGCRLLPDGELEFRVNNAGELPEIVQLQIFQRSFSTKGEGRGLGLYGAKLLCERYLKGHVDFESNAADGATFKIRVKATPPEQAQASEAS